MVPGLPGLGQLWLRFETAMAAVLVDLHHPSRGIVLLLHQKRGQIKSMPRAFRRQVSCASDKGEETPGSVSIWESLLLSATYFTSGASSIISAAHTEIVPVGRGRYVVVLLRLLGWIFFVIFLSALTKAV